MYEIGDIKIIIRYKYCFPVYTNSISLSIFVSSSLNAPSIEGSIAISCATNRRTITDL
jgi:hypothetical protein